MPQINLGGMVSGGSTKLSGISSGLDTQALIESAVEAKSIPIKNLEEQIEIDNNKASAFSDLSKLLNDFKDSADKLRLGSSFGASSDDVFGRKKIVASTNDSLSADKYVVIASENNAEISSFKIEVVATAKEKIQQTKPFASKTDSAVVANQILIPPSTDVEFKEGTFQINGIDISLVQGDSLVEVASKINLEKSNTNVKAQIIQPNVGEYRLVLQATQTGVANDITFNDPDGVLNGVFDYDEDDNPNNIIQAASDSQIKFNNFLVNRSTNTIDDFMDGISITILKETPPGVEISIDIIDDKSFATDEIINFVEKYNAAMAFIEAQQERDSNGQFVETAIIRNNSLLNQIKGELAIYITSAPSGSTNLVSLTEIGINFKDNHELSGNASGHLLLEIDWEKFGNAMESSYDDVKKLFQYQYTSSSSKFIMTGRSNNLSDSNISIDVDISRDSAEIAKVDVNGVDINATFTPFDPEDFTKGGYIIGNEGTELHGYKFAYTGSGTDVANIEFTQGIGDKMFNLMDSYLTKNYRAVSGNSSFNASLIDLEIYGLRDNIQTSNVEIEKKQHLIDKYRESLVNKYAALEGAVAKANTIIGALEAQNNMANKK